MLFRSEAVLEKYNACENKLSSQIKKYFIGNLSYHAEEILGFIEDEKYIFDRVLKNIENAPILWLAIFMLEQNITQNELIDNIDICWDRTQFYLENLNCIPLFKKDTTFQKDLEKNIENICQTLTNQWGGTYDFFEDKIRFIFDEPSQFEKLKEKGWIVSKWAWAMAVLVRGGRSVRRVKAKKSSSTSDISINSLSETCKRFSYSEKFC